MISATRSLVLVFLCLTIALLAATRGASAERMILHDAQSLREADATRVVITKLETISDRGFYPRFSPSGTSILYTVDESRYVFMGSPSLWVMDVDGKNKRMVVANAYQGAWSADGKRLAYFALRPDPKHPERAYPPTLAIYDLQTRKEYEIMPGFNTNFGSLLDPMLWWTSDGQKIYVDGGGLVDLNTLKFSNTGTLSLRDKLPLVRHVYPKISFAIVGTGMLWAENLDGSFSRALLPSSVGVWSPGLTRAPDIEISPDLSKLAITLRGHPNGNITLAHLGMLREAPVRVFQARIARADLVEPQNVAGHLGFRSDAILEEYLRFGSITATVYERRVNPLNGRVVGPGEVVKGDVRIRKLLNDRLIVEVVRESLPIQAGDVLAHIQGNPPKDSGLGTRNILNPLWAILEATARAPEPSAPVQPPPPTPSPAPSPGPAPRGQEAPPARPTIAALTRDIPDAAAFREQERVFAAAFDDVWGAAQHALSRTSLLKRQADRIVTMDRDNGVLVTAPTTHSRMLGESFRRQLAILIERVTVTATRVTVKGLCYDQKGMNKWTRWDPDRCSDHFIQELEKALAEAGKR